MNTLSFLNAPLLWGLSLAAIPLVIHLLYRRQYRRIDWAPMRYLKLSIERNRRRIRIEQILLLLLRTAIVLLLFFLVARPVMHAGGLSGLLGAAARTNRIVVLDDSLSAAYTVEGKSALARGQDLLADLLGTFGAKDALTLVLVSAPREPLLREVEPADTDALLSVVRGVPPSEVFGAWEPVLAALDELMARGTYPIYEISLVTDLRRSGWEQQLAERAGRWAAAGVRLRVLDVGDDATDNVALANLRQVDRVALTAVPTHFDVDITNNTTSRRAGLEANLLVDGQATLVRVPELAPGETISLSLAPTFQEAGQHDVVFELPDDNLPGDNHLAAVVDVRESMSVRLVDGEPSLEPLGGETDFLGLALSLSGDAADAFRVEVVTDAEWAALPPLPPDLTVLANVARLAPEQVDTLEHQVAAGMGLAIFLGDQVDPDNYNQLLYKNGAGLLPAGLVTTADEEVSGLLVESNRATPLAALAQLTPAALQRIKVRKTYEVKLPDEASQHEHPPTRNPQSPTPNGKLPDEVFRHVRVLARWNNQAAAPAVLHKAFGDGNVLLWTTAADRAWSDWPTEASYVLAARESCRAIARAGARSRGFAAGQPLTVAVPASHEIAEPLVEVPRAGEPRPLTVNVSPAGAGAPATHSELVYRDTRRSGLYTMRWRDSASGESRQRFAVNPDPRESELARLDHGSLRRMWSPLELEIVSVGGGHDAALAVRGREIWRMLAGCLLGMLVFESCFARWAGRQR